MPERPAVRQTEVLRRVLESHAVDLHTGLPGKVRAYDRDTQTADVEIQLRRVLPSGDDDDEDQTEAYPVLPSVPVLWPRGGGYFLHAPLTVGDFVQVVFSEQDIGRWRETGEISDPGVGTRHGLSGAAAIPGMFWRGNPIQNLPEDTGLVLGRDGGAQVLITSNQIRAGGGDTIAKADPQSAINDAIIADLQTLAAAINLIATGAVTVPTSSEAVQAANPIATSTLRGA